METLEKNLTSKKWIDKLEEDDIKLLEKMVECNRVLGAQVLIFVQLHGYVSGLFNENLIITDGAAMSDETENGYDSNPDTNFSHEPSGEEKNDL
jgi:hypothetical protein